MKVSIVRCKEYDKDRVYSAVKKSIELIGGLPFERGSKILVKPNLLRPKHIRYAVTTHPEVVRAVIRLLKEHGCKAVVGDNPGFHTPLETAKVSGILDVCEEEDVPFLDLSKKKTYMYKKGLFMKRFELSDILDDVDYIINVPKIKTHMMMGVTLAVKNTFGLMPGLDKSQMHLKMEKKDRFGSMLVDLNNFIRPAISIMDGIIGMEGQGPGAGDPKHAGIISASYDCLAMDIVICRLIGIEPLDIWTNKIGLKTRNKGFLEDIEIAGERLDDVKVKFKPAEQQEITAIIPEGIAKIIRDITTSKPIVSPERCKSCEECMRICPARAIKMKEEGKKTSAYIDDKRCIRCYCCHEICPHKAVDIKMSLGGRVLTGIKRMFKPDKV